VLSDPKEIDAELAVRKMKRVDLDIASGKKKLISMKSVLEELGIKETELE